MTDYEDIIHLSRPLSKKHPPMSMHDRAAQFSPFAALSGHDEVIAQTGRRKAEEMENGGIEVETWEE